MEQNSNRAEAERLLGVAEKLLTQGDFNGSKEFAILAQETEPLLDGSDQIIAVADVLIAADKRINNHHDWYSILQIDRRSDDQDLIKKQFRRFAFLLHPDKNKYPFADRAFRLVADAWAVLSDARKKSPYDHELSLFTNIDLTNSDSTQPGKLPVRRGRPPNSTKKNNPRDDNYNHNRHEEQRSKLSTFWTTCPYCYILYEYPKVYENCCLRCQNCRRGFHAILIPKLPPLVPGKEAYYCCWGFFPMGYSAGNHGNGVATPPSTSGFPNWMPPLFPGGGSGGVEVGPKEGGVGAEAQGRNGDINNQEAVPRKRGRPKKNPF
ncbi:dnaJ homolog subfamily C member 14 [Mangifera indica]|uniref:dnaJ homolog subfamily C member 14 n=1 Tax=Mangifera indica TaxID=29780 RepID=UPI001CF961AE|nr:dnaJ homolog subfamily C member 14 [Mangifera indica]